MGFIAWIIFGFVVGLIARAIVPGRQHMGVVLTTILGIAGSLIGGIVASAITGQSLAQLHGAGFLGSVIGAVLLLVIAIALMRSRRRVA